MLSRWLLLLLSLLSLRAQFCSCSSQRHRPLQRLSPHTHPPAPTARRRDVEKLGDALLPPAFLVRFVGQLKVVRCLKIPRSRAMGVMRHAFEEFNTLGAILPQVFEQEASAEWKARSEDELRSRGEAQ